MIPVLLACALLGLSGLHFYWAAGGLWAKRLAIPEIEGKPAFTPSRLLTTVVAVALACAAGIAILRGFFLFSSFPGSPAHWASIGIGVLFVLRAIGDFRLVGFFKRIRGTDFALWDSWLYCPACLLIASAFFAVAAS
ncbi:DUF3995 domain-containing protein [Simplicispira suum]|uniref:DUF3995 domain-containing protein n=1 Tax=Simplicispira suum TaxID=2109915 RepID=A0A2S0MXT7_9BURK|nr:DUF3995 domain-containing protein [Simplicispira suum]AVO40531.1 DUF3995 domain-containing protein [Simplicispira suum]MBW7832279.1 DUF3995 domain-containing protein [Simplicispira suum]